MAYIEKTAYHLDRKDEVPNQELAKELAESENKDGIQEIASYLNKKTNPLQVIV